VNLSKFILVTLLAGLVFYSVGMIIVRIKMTETAYEFEDHKSNQRALEEEQVRLKMKISERLSVSKLKLKDFSEPTPEQIIEIPLPRGNGK